MWIPNHMSSYTRSKFSVLKCIPKWDIWPWKYVSLKNNCKLWLSTLTHYISGEKWGYLSCINTEATDMAHIIAPRKYSGNWPCDAMLTIHVPEPHSGASTSFEKLDKRVKCSLNLKSYYPSIISTSTLRHSKYLLHINKYQVQMWSSFNVQQRQEHIKATHG